MKNLLLTLVTIMMTACVASKPVYHQVKVDSQSYGYISEDLVDEIETSTDELGSIDVVNSNQVRACGFIDLSVAKQQAINTVLTNKSAIILSRSQTVCDSSNFYEGCINELDVLSSGKASVGSINTEFEGNGCYLFTFEDVSFIPSKMKSVDSYSVYDKINTDSHVSSIKINVVNTDTLVKARINGEVTFLNDKEFLDYYGPTTVHFEIIDNRFMYKKFDIKVSRKAQYITKNISLTPVNRNYKPYVKQIGLGYVRQDYKACDETGKCMDEAFFTELVNHYRFDISKVKHNMSIQQKMDTLFTMENALAEHYIGIGCYHHDRTEKGMYLTCRAYTTIRDYKDKFYATNKVFNHEKYWKPFLRNSRIPCDYYHFNIKVTLYGRENKEKIVLNIPFSVNATTGFESSFGYATYTSRSDIDYSLPTFSTYTIWDYSASSAGVGLWMPGGEEQALQEYKFFSSPNEKLTGMDVKVEYVGSETSYEPYDGHYHGF